MGFLEPSCMKLHIIFFSLAKFRELYDESEYLQSVLSLNDGNCWYIETDDTSEIKRLLNGRDIKYKIK